MLNRLWKSSGGAAAVEFAIIAPTMLLFIFGLYEFGRLFWVQDVIQFAAEETERYGMAHFTDPVAGCTSAALSAQFDARLAGLDPADPNLSVVYSPVVISPSVGAIKACQIKASYNFNFLGGLVLPGVSYTLIGQAQSPFGQ